MRKSADERDKGVHDDAVALARGGALLHSDDGADGGWAPEFEGGGGGGEGSGFGGECGEEDGGRGAEGGVLQSE